MFTSTALGGGVGLKPRSAMDVLVCTISDVPVTLETYACGTVIRLGDTECMHVHQRKCVLHVFVLEGW